MALLDEVGLDVAQKAAEVMQAAFGERMRPAVELERLLQGGRLGRKNGRGFYRYHDGHKSGVDDGVYASSASSPRRRPMPTTVERRLVYAMLNEAAMACGEGVIRSARDGDIGAIYRHRVPRLPRRPPAHDRRSRRGPGDRDAVRAPGPLRRAIPPGARAGGDGPAGGAVLPGVGARVSRRAGMLRILAALIAGYVVLVLLVWAMEPRLVFAPGAARRLTPPPAALGLDPEPVHFRAEDGVELSAWVMRPPAKAADARWLLICHGNAGNLSESGRAEHYAGLRALGVGLVAFDYRGYGESEGSPDERGVYLDAVAAYRYLRDTLGVPAERIVLFGHSLGSAVAVELATREPAAGLILDGALLSAVARGQELYPWLPVRLIARNHSRATGRSAGSPFPSSSSTPGPTTSCRSTTGGACSRWPRSPSASSRSAAGTATPSRWTAPPTTAPSRPF